MATWKNALIVSAAAVSLGTLGVAAAQPAGAVAVPAKQESVKCLPG